MNRPVLFFLASGGLLLESCNVVHAPKSPVVFFLALAGLLLVIFGQPLLVRLFFGPAPQRPVSKYQNEFWDFALVFPEGWTARSSAPERSQQPEFDGPSGSSLKFAIGPVRPIPTARQQCENLRRIAIKHGHECLEVGTIEISGLEHATVLSRIPIIGVVKSYSLIFNGTEFLVTAKGDFAQIDSVLHTFVRM